jgi:hypothetical protein
MWNMSDLISYLPGWLFGHVYHRTEKETWVERCTPTECTYFLYVVLDSLHASLFIIADTKLKLALHITHYAQSGTCFPLIALNIHYISREVPRRTDKANFTIANTYKPTNLVR